MTWRIQDVTTALAMTRTELNRVISLALFTPSHAPSCGRRRHYDWRDVMCLAVARELRRHGLDRRTAFFLAGGELRVDLKRLPVPHASAGLFFFVADLDEVGAVPDRVGLVRTEQVLELLAHVEPRSAVPVDVAKVGTAALDRLRTLLSPRH